MEAPPNGGGTMGRSYTDHHRWGHWWAEWRHAAAGVAPMVCAFEGREHRGLNKQAQRIGFFSRLRRR